MKTLALPIMIFLHIIDDFYLQGVLAKFKQKRWWHNNPQYNKLYKYDYIISLIIHAFSWSFMISIPGLILAAKDCDKAFCYIILLIINTIFHSIIDDLKANQLKINLIQDQLFHLIQIILTWLILI